MDRVSKGQTQIRDLICFIFQILNCISWLFKFYKSTQKESLTQRKILRTWPTHQLLSRKRHGIKKLFNFSMVWMFKAFKNKHVRRTEASKYPRSKIRISRWSTNVQHMVARVDTSVRRRQSQDTNTTRKKQKERKTLVREYLKKNAIPSQFPNLPPVFFTCSFWRKIQGVYKLSKMGKILPRHGRQSKSLSGSR